MEIKEIKEGLKVKLDKESEFYYQTAGSQYGIVTNLYEQISDYNGLQVYWINVKWYDKSGKMIESNNYPHIHLHPFLKKKKKKTKYLF